MRQAGRYLPGYKEVRKAYSVLEVCKTPRVCGEVTLMPVRELGVDAAVMFADIMLPLEGMGVEFRIEENVGPIIANPIGNVDETLKLKSFDPDLHVPFMLEAIRDVASTLKDTSKSALIGFSGAPFTIASYLIEGQPSRDFTKTKRMMYGDQEAWKLLMTKLVEMISDYLCAQIRAGVDAVQLFDSWVGTLSSADYEVYVAPFVRQIFERVHREHPETPKIHFGTNTLHLLKAMKEKVGGAEVFSIDWRTPIRKAREILGEGIAIQGNLEPAVLLLSDRREEGFIARRIQSVLDDNAGARGYVFNLGHGILRDTPVENAKFAVEYVHKHTSSN